MARKEFVVEEVQKMMENIDNVRNVAIVAHVDHGKTTLTDSLVARAGLISKELAGAQRWTDFDEQEQARGITIKSANISLGFSFEGKDYLINLIDTPGHVDFGFHVVRAMRAVDGICLVVDAVEGVMPQTETNLRQALKERAKPVLFINKIDRLINELKLDSQQMQQRFLKIIMQVNKIIAANAPPDKKDDWLIDVNKGNVAFGTAFNKWALSIKSMKKFNISFKEMYQKCIEGDHKYLVERSPLDEVLLEMIITHLPSPRVAQPYRIPVLWKDGDINSEIGKAMLNCDPKAKTVGVCFGVVYDEHAGEVAVVRLFSGTIQKGDQLYINSKKTFAKVQQVGIYMGPDRVQAERVTAGNIGAIVGLKDVYVGETISTEPIPAFEQIKHYSEPVITKSIDVKEQKDLPKLIEALRSISKEDPTLRVQLAETGEHLISGNGELHLEIIEYKIRNEKKIPIITSPPIVVYREAIFSKSPPVEGKSPNKHNRLKVTVEPLEPEIVNAINEGIIKEGRPKGKEVAEREIFRLAQDHKEKKLKIITKRVDKNFPVTSVEVNMKLGRILEERGYKIDLRDPEKTIYIEILPEEIIVSCERQEGLGGLPIGSSGKLLCLFSGGIDSPVAAWMMMKRGCVVDLLHVHATMDKEFIKNSKIMRLHDILSEYSPKKITLYLVPYDEFYSKIHTRNEFERSEAILFRRFIVRLANELADRYGYDGFITGDSLGQVASQTVENIAAVDAVAKKPIYRPLVAMDKEEIMALAQKIGTYEKSIEHYKDCCSLVASARPKTKTKKEKLDEMEKSINIDEVVGKTLETIETI